MKRGGGSGKLAVVVVGRRRCRRCRRGREERRPSIQGRPSMVEPHRD